MKPSILALLACFVFGACAQTTFYRNGQRVAHFQGDMRGMTFRSSSDGTIEWIATAVSHSTATRAGGSVVGTAGTAVAASGILGLVK